MDGGVVTVAAGAVALAMERARAVALAGAVVLGLSNGDCCGVYTGAV